MKIQSFQKSVLVLLIGLLLSSISFAQKSDVKDYRLRFNFNTIKQSDNSRLLEVKFEATNKKDRKDKVPVYEANIIFINVLEDQEIILGKSKTDKEGIAQLTIPENHVYLTNKEGYINLKAVFEGKGDLDSEEDEIAIKDLFLDLNLSEIDSVKTVSLKAFTLDSLKTKVPVEELDVVFSIGGMLSKMPLEEATLENGKYKFEFPENISGDREGNLDVFVTVDDHDDFGNLILKKNVNWGLSKEKAQIDNYTLWSDVAPIWMYVVLTLLLIGVWSNYIYSFINLLKIKKEGKEIETEKKLT